MENFLSNLERLLLDGNKSRATDLLTEFLFTTHGKPTSLTLPESQSLIDKSPAEIVAILRVLLKTSLAEVATQRPESDLLPNSDDLFLIEENEKIILEKTPDYLLDEESIIPPFPPPLTLTNQTYYPGTPVITGGNDSDFHANIEENTREVTSNSSDVGIRDGVDEISDFETMSGVETVTLLPDYEIDGLDETEDFEEPDHFRDGLPDKDRISIADRAQQIAITVIKKYNLDDTDLDFLQQVFIEHGWGNARIAIEGLLEIGTSVKQLNLAKQMKDHWEDSSDLWIGFYATRKDSSDYTYASSQILSWVFAVKFIKNFHEDIEFEEIEHFIYSQYDVWWEEKRSYYKSFFEYLKFITEYFDEIYLSNSIPFNDETYN